MSSLKNINKFILASFVTYLGNGIQILGAAYVSFTITQSIFSIGGVFLAYATPQVLASYFVQNKISRFGVKYICVWSDYIRAVLMLLLGLVVYIDFYVLFFTFSITILASIMDAFFVPSSNGFFQRILNNTNFDVNKESSRLETMTQIAMLLSVTVGAFLADRLGSHYIFFINSISFFVSGYILNGISLSNVTLDPLKSERNRSRNPISIYLDCFIRHRADVLNFSLARVVPNVMNTVTTYFVVKSLSQTFLTLGLIDACASIGFAIGAWLYPYLVLRFRAANIMLFTLSATAILISLQPLGNITILAGTFFMATATFGVSRVAARTSIINNYDDTTSETIYATSNLLGMALAIVLTIVVCYVESLFNIQLAYFVIALFLLSISIYIWLSSVSQRLSMDSNT